MKEICFVNNPTFNYIHEDLVAIFLYVHIYLEINIFKYLSDNVYLAEKNDNGSKTVKSTKVHLEVVQQILFTSCDTVKNHSLATPP